ncbi:MAG TPA: tetratricopeptide repeat protein [Vicinamibacteria bacterium]|nr:tetratricopeptide repeat protein [Vicinamibacteria bacterium]
MNLTDETLLVALVALASGVVLGRLWAKLARGRAQDPAERHSRSIHYILGLDLLASRNLDRAALELTKAARENTEATDIYLILGNVLREKGQLERAIQIHQSVLHRPGLSRSERAHVLLCLGTDFKRAGFRNRAMQTFEEVTTIEPKNAYALHSLVKIYEEEQDWNRALRAQEELSRASGSFDATVEAFLYDRIGSKAWSDQELTRASQAFEASLRADPRIAPARIHYGDLLESEGRFGEAESQWRALAKESPHLAYLVFERLERVRERLGTQEKTEQMYEEIVHADHRDWRARLALAELRSAASRREEAFDLLLGAARANPHALAVQLAVVRFLAEEQENTSPRLRRYLDVISRSAFFLDPHVCIKCNYRTNGIHWRCPHCQEWNAFVEERLETSER